VNTEGQCWGPNVYLHRGNVTTAQENTYDALVPKNGDNVEMYITRLKDGTAVLFHDNNLKRLTGYDKHITSVSNYSELMTEYMPIKQNVDGHVYNSTAIVPKLETIVHGICNNNEKGGIVFDTKSISVVKSEVDALRSSNCSSNTEETVLWSCYLPFIIPLILKELKKYGMKNRISSLIPPFFLQKFLIKTRLLQGIAPGASIIAFHKTVWDVEYDNDLIQDWVKDGWCLGIWGIFEEDVPKYKADYYVVDSYRFGFFTNFLPIGDKMGGDDVKLQEDIYIDTHFVFYYFLILIAWSSLLLGVYLLLLIPSTSKKHNYGKANKDELKPLITTKEK